ncbi:unnamed protein product [Rotaria sp. Silwood1]|nr:unnamed protein product [Rotaria sp. Silwood1]
MATPSRFESGIQLPTLDTYESVFEKSKQAPGKLIVVLFNVQFPDRGTIESGLKNWQNHYKNTYGTEFYKCIISRGKQKIKSDFKIEDTPTFIFIRDGSEICRIDDLEEANPNISQNILPVGESQDEKRLKAKLDELCKKP